MCGICGGTDINRDYEKALQTIDHRGPNDKRIVEIGEVVLSFCRLSIIDLSDRAMQPMSSEDGMVYVLFNGEIYGYKKLRKEIEHNYNYKYRTESDTELILSLYVIFGENFIKRIDGMFAIVIYDKRNQTINIYRDRAGIKPIYFYHKNQELLFASELKAIKELLNQKELEIDNTALYDYMSYGYVPDPKSIYKNIRKLEPATYLVYNLEEKRIEKQCEYWKLDVNSNVGVYTNGNSIKEKYRELVKKSISEQLVSDVPIGLFFSGGIDSSIIAYEAKKIGNESIDSFSIGFSNQGYSEDKYIRKFAEEINIKNRLYFLDKNQLDSELVKKYLRWFDEPFDDMTAMPTYLLSLESREKVTVALSGDGNDELFGGYNHQHNYYHWEKDGIEAKVDYWINNNLCSLKDLKDLYSGLIYYASLYGCVPDRFRKVKKKDLNIPDDYDEYWFLRKYWITSLPIYTRARYADFKTYLVGDILTKTDRSSMAASLEVRVPFLSRELIEFAFSLSQNECNMNGEMKGLVKNAYKGMLSDNLLYRKKHGFTVPINDYLIKKARGYGRRFGIYNAYIYDYLA